jgi:hypothetical protein
MGAAVEKADRLLKEEAPWPGVDALQKFGFHLQRCTTSWFLKKWCPRFFVLENRRLYYSDGKNGHPDTREGTVSFLSSNPQPGSRYCVDLAGATDCMPSECMQAVMVFVGCTVESSHETVDGQEFVFEIKFPPGSQVQVVQLMRNSGIWHLHLSLSKTFVVSQSKMLRLAASDDVTRKRCIRVIQAASSSCRSSSPHSIATEVAMSRELFRMKSITAVKSVLAALGVTLDKNFLTSIKFDFSLLKEFEYDPSELLSSGFDLSCLKAANFTAQELQGLAHQAFSFKEAGFSAKELNEIYDLPSLIDAGYSVSELKTAGFTKMQLTLAGLSEQQLQDGFSVPELKSQFFEMPMRSPYDPPNEISIAAAPNHVQSDSAASPADNQNTARSFCCKLQKMSACYFKVLEVVKKHPKIAVIVVVLIIVSVILGATLRSPESNMPSFLGSCSDKVTKCDVGAICTALVAGTSYSCSCPSWMSGSGDVGSPCRCSLSDYSVPDFERGVCVTRASSMSQGQVSGVVLGCLAYAATTLGILGRVYHHKKRLLIVGVVVLFSVLVIGLSTGLTKNQWAPTPKVFCGKSSADFVLCDYNAACVSNSCVCNRDYVGDGITCRDPDSDSSSSSTGLLFLILM